MRRTKTEYLRLANRTYLDDQMTMAEWEARDEVFPKDKTKIRKLVFRGENAVAGFCLMEGYWTPQPGMFMCSTVDDGLGRDDMNSVFAAIEAEALAQGASELHDWLSNKRTTVTDVLKERGFEMVQSNAQNEADLSAFELSRFQEAVDAFDASELEFLNILDIAERFEDWKHRYWNAEFALAADVPVPWEKKQTPFEDWERDLDCEKKSWPWLYAVLDGEKIVAMTMLFRGEADPGRFHTGLTAVDPSYRRRGIAKAIKAKAMQAAKEAGGRVVGTDNEENNPMLQLNIELGFRTVYHWENYRKRF